MIELDYELLDKNGAARTRVDSFTYSFYKSLEYKTLVRLRNTEGLGLDVTTKPNYKNKWHKFIAWVANIFSDFNRFSTTLVGFAGAMIYLSTGYISVSYKSKSGMTFFHYLTTLLHEAGHVLQARKTGVIGFYLKYLLAPPFILYTARAKMERECYIPELYYDHALSVGLLKAISIREKTKSNPDLAIISYCDHQIVENIERLSKKVKHIREVFTNGYGWMDRWGKIVDPELKDAEVITSQIPRSVVDLHFEDDYLLNDLNIDIVGSLKDIENDSSKHS